MLVAANAYAASSSDSFDDAVGGCRRASVGNSADRDRLAGGCFNERFADGDSEGGRRRVCTRVGVCRDVYIYWGLNMSSDFPSTKWCVQMCPGWSMALRTVPRVLLVEIRYRRLASRWIKFLSG